jgi:hypothetical protein
MTQQEFTNEMKKKLMLSVGEVHLPTRPYSPIEVAEAISIALSSGETKETLAELLHLKGTSMLGKFQKLLTLSPNISHLISWGKGNFEKISFTVGSEIAKLQAGSQIILAKSSLEYSLTSTEVKEIIQVFKRSKKDINTCIKDILNLRKVIEKRGIFIGSIKTEPLREKISMMDQLEKDKLLSKILEVDFSEAMPSSFSLSEKEFVMSGDELFLTKFKSITNNFEEYINNMLMKEI